MPMALAGPLRRFPEIKWFDRGDLYPCCCSTVVRVEGRVIITRRAIAVLLDTWTAYIVHVAMYRV
jgi:hypothetical protein